MIWRACERWSILPPSVKSNFEDNAPWVQAKMLAFEQIREVEEIEYGLANKSFG